MNLPRLIHSGTLLNLAVLHLDMKLQSLRALEGLSGLLAPGQLGVSLMCECLEIA